MKIFNFRGIIFVLFTGIILLSCEKNQAPICQILKPEDGSAEINTLVAEASIYRQMIVGGEVTYDGAYPVSETGVYWGTNPHPVCFGTRLTIGSQMDSFSSTLANLDIESTYYIVAFAVNSVGESLGEKLTYKVPDPVLGSFTDSRDQEVYGTLVIGEQVWMTENLRATTFNDGTDIPHKADAYEWSASDGPAYCWYNNDPEAGDWKMLYNWYTVDTKLLCPAGWHIPSESEWQHLEYYLGMHPYLLEADGFRGANVGGMLKATTHWDAPNTGASDELGFSVLPVGRRGAEGEFLYGTQTCFYWTSDIGLGNNPMRRLFYYSEGGISRSAALRSNGLSVRCVKD